jgi:hypothetical protein
VLDDDFLRRPMHRLAVMARGPRWNTHAVIATSGGAVRVSGPLTIDVATAARSAEQWSWELRRLDRRRATVIGSTNVDPGQERATVDVEPGLYTFVMRYYGVRPGAALPEIRLFPDTVVAATPVPASALSVYESLRGRRPWLFVVLQAYVYALLRFRRWLPEPFVRREYLPVANPDTSFLFGSVERNARLAIAVPRSLLDTHLVLFTAYNRASFPTVWFRVDAPATGVAVPAQGTWLLRVHARTGGAAAADLDAIRVTAGTVPGPERGADRIGQSVDRPGII